MVSASRTKFLPTTGTLNGASFIGSTMPVPPFTGMVGGRRTMITIDQ